MSYPALAIKNAVFHEVIGEIRIKFLRAKDAVNPDLGMTVA
ncbi:hypothetical protein JOE11_003222 [Robbsia andropogonis]